jgi:tight adherence protein C
MSTQLVVTLSAVFLSVTLLVVAISSLVISRSATGRRRLSSLAQSHTSIVLGPAIPQLTEAPDPFWDRITETLPTSRGTVQRLRREMMFAGYHSTKAAALFSLSELLCPLLLAVPPILLLTGLNRWIVAGIGAFMGYMLPGILLGMRLRRRKKDIQNGLADALDLLVLCLEAGSSLDQAIVKAGEELKVAYPALGDQLHILIAEMRAGKPRLEAFRGLAARTQVDDVRALVAMLVQTDRFGTSISQALRTHADVCRTKRRQRAEESAQKVGVKLVFPLVFCLFPALYVVMLGPAYIQFTHVFGEAAK